MGARSEFEISEQPPAEGAQGRETDAEASGRLRNVFEVSSIERRPDDDAFAVAPEVKSYAKLDNVNFRVSNESRESVREPVTSPLAWSSSALGLRLVAVFFGVAVASLSLYAYRLDRRIAALEQRMVSKSAASGAPAATQRNEEDMRSQPDSESRSATGARTSAGKGRPEAEEKAEKSASDRADEAETDTVGDITENAVTQVSKAIDGINSEPTAEPQPKKATRNKRKGSGKVKEENKK